MDNQLPNIALYLNCDDPYSLLLLPEHGASGTIASIASRAKNESESIEIPYLSMEQDVLLYILKKAISEPHRGRGRAANSAKPPKSALISSLSPEHHICKSWLQYFRAIILKTSIIEIASTIQIATSSWRKWERPSAFLPPQYWFDLLWRWYARCYTTIYKDKAALEEPHRLPQWAEVTTQSERLELVKKARPRYFHQLDLKRKQAAMEEKWK